MIAQVGAEVLDYDEEMNLNDWAEQLEQIRIPQAGMGVRATPMLFRKAANDLHAKIKNIFRRCCRRRAPARAPPPQRTHGRTAPPTTGTP